MKIERRPELPSTGVLHYFLMYVVAIVVGGIGGALIAPRVSAKAYVNRSAPTLEVAQEWSIQSAWICIFAGSALACLYVTGDLVYTHFADRRALQLKLKEKDLRLRGRLEWEKQYGPKEEGHRADSEKN